jgi:hypothetical protein
MTIKTRIAKLETEAAATPGPPAAGRGIGPRCENAMATAEITRPLSWSNSIALIPSPRSSAHEKCCTGRNAMNRRR